jgi:hypothetical protein
LFEDSKKVSLLMCIEMVMVMGIDMVMVMVLFINSIFDISSLISGIKDFIIQAILAKKFIFELNMIHVFQLSASTR